MHNTINTPHQSAFAKRQALCAQATRCIILVIIVLMVFCIFTVYSLYNQLSIHNNSNKRKTNHNLEQQQPLDHNNLPKMRAHEMRFEVQPDGIHQKVLVDKGGREVNQAVPGYPSSNSNNNNNNKGAGSVPGLRVFQVKPMLTGTLPWMPQFTGSTSGQLVFMDSRRQQNKVSWSVAQTEHPRVLFLSNVNIGADTVALFRGALERTTRQAINTRSLFSQQQQQQQQQQHAAATSTGKIREQLDIAKFKIVSVLGMNAKKAGHDIWLASVETDAETDESGWPNLIREQVLGICGRGGSSSNGNHHHHHHKQHHGEENAADKNSNNNDNDDNSSGDNGNDGGDAATSAENNNKNNKALPRSSTATLIPLSTERLPQFDAITFYFVDEHLKDETDLVTAFTGKMLGNIRSGRGEGNSRLRAYAVVCTFLL